ncbi:MED14-domain-containing protein [Calocera viscosa TUFC12733]|uniref:Mediator of RNA polymerase II transcription subunit 14 n=1 Tax=Calocera viscosa (strain TUFC12733) TaxID=1330018 RepID=A0A167GND6_CALVF|nr:MED14-domain-containing protein [Calocera viscosa TUFC12733]
MVDPRPQAPNGLLSPSTAPKQAKHANGHQKPDPFYLGTVGEGKEGKAVLEGGAGRLSPPLLPHELTDMVPLREVVGRLVQKAYEDLQNLVEVLPSKTDTERKHLIREYGALTRKQTVKSLVLARWARDAPIVQRCQDVRFFLQLQNGQFRETAQRLEGVRRALGGARSRAWDLGTAVDVMQSGTYLRLPKIIKQWFLPPARVTPSAAIHTLQSMNSVLRLRLRTSEIVPIEMSSYRVADGRVYFTVPSLFAAAFVTGGAERNQGWYLLDVEFLIGARDRTRIFERFPRRPQGAMRDQIINLVNQQLALGQDAPPAEEPELPPGRRRRRARVAMVDAPLVRAYNFLQMFALGYQLEILHYQASLLISSLGWTPYLRLEFSRDRRTLTAHYWQKPRPPPPPGNPPWPSSQSKVFGGTVTVSLESRASQGRTALGKVLAELEDRSKSGHGGAAGKDVLVRTRDKVDGLRLRVIWQPALAWAGLTLQDTELKGDEFDVDPRDLDFEAVLARVIRRHADALLRAWWNQMRMGASAVVFRQEEIGLVQGDGTLEMHVRFRPQEQTVLSLDVRSGAFVARELGVLPSLSRVEKIAALVRQINDKPTTFVEAVCMTRFTILLEDLEKKASVLRTNVTKTRLVRVQDMPAFGPTARLFLYIALASFPSHYLVLVLADSGLQYAMLKVALVNEDVAPEFQILECAWLDIRRITGADPAARDRRWTISADALCDLYAFCRARVAHAELEQQLRDVKIASWPTFDSPSAGASRIETLPFASPLLQKEVPTIRIESSAFLGAMSSDASTMSADAWCAYIAFRAINWTRLYGTVGVIVSVALRSEFFVPLADEKSTTGEYAGVRVKLDSKTGVINFHLESVHGAIVAFLRAWEGVSKAVSVAREVRTMSQEPRYAGVQLLSFTLSSVSLLYQNSFALTISSHGSTSLVFSYHGTPGRRNPHEEGVEHYSRVFEESGPRKLIEILRDTLPLLLEFDQLEKSTSVKMLWVLREAGWVRATYGDSRHALDFRLLPNSRLLVVDGAVHLFSPVGKVLFPLHPAITLMRESSEKLSRLYQAIDGLPSLLLDVTRSVAKERAGMVSTRSGRDKMPDVVPLDAGLMCHQDVVRSVVRLVHEGTLKLLEGPAS